MTLSTKTDEEIDAEINALETSINRTKKIGSSEVNKQIKDELTSTVGFLIEDSSDSTFDDSSENESIR